MENAGQLIIEIESKTGSREAMIDATLKATGDEDPFFCPASIVEGQPYKGHVHVFPPAAATNIAIQKIVADR